MGLIGVRLRRGDLLAERLRPEVGVGPLLLDQKHTLSANAIYNIPRQGAKARREPESARPTRWRVAGTCRPPTARTGSPPRLTRGPRRAGSLAHTRRRVGPVQTACTLQRRRSPVVDPASPRRPRAVRKLRQLHIMIPFEAWTEPRKTPDHGEAKAPVRGDSQATNSKLRRRQPDRRRRAHTGTQSRAGPAARSLLDQEAADSGKSGVPRARFCLCHDQNE